MSIINRGNQSFSSQLAENLTVLLFLGLPLGIAKAAHAHTRALDIKSHLRWRLDNKSVANNNIDKIVKEKRNNDKRN